MKQTIFATLIAVSLLLTGCIYRIDVQQGNVITQEKVQRLTIGMSKSEVKFELGTPLVDDPFHTDRWDYYYSLKTGKKQKTITQQLISLYFENDQLAKISGNAEVQTAKVQVSEGLSKQKKSKKKSKKKGFFKRYKDKFKKE
ncbi:MAG: outer membrane protein assembly factor BamE [Arenicellales bacterium WSBS_2016_MAG_OTU3]